MKNIVLFDDDCVLCKRAVVFVIKRDRKRLFFFAPISSPAGEQLLREYRITERDCSTLFLFENGASYRRSTAVLRIARKLDGLWPLVYVFIVVPPFVRDRIYDFIATHRHRLFRKPLHMDETTKNEYDARLLRYGEKLLGISGE